jgi:hypothetical protein
MGVQCLVEPGTLQPFLHDQLLVAGDHPNRFDRGLAVGLDREVLELPALLGNDCQRAAPGMHVHPDVPFHPLAACR